MKTRSQNIDFINLFKILIRFLNRLTAYFQCNLLSFAHNYTTNIINSILKNNEAKMKGSILDFSIQTNTGIINGDDGQRYNFAGAEWRGQRSPNRGDRVDFDIDAEGQAVQIYTALANSTSPAQAFNQQLDKISNQDQSEEQFNMIDWFVKCLKNYANFTGRARRKEYWFFTLAYLICMIITLVIDAVLGSNGLLTVLFILAMIVPSISVGVRRLHDINKSGWFWLIQMVPLVGPIIVLIWLATETKPETNQWGNPAK